MYPKLNAIQNNRFIKVSILLCFFMTVILCFVFSGEIVRAEDDLSDFTWQVRSDTVTINSYTGNAEVVSVPETIEGLPVTTIGYSAFYQNTSVREVILPDTVTTIMGYAFGTCEKLEKVTIPNRVTNISTSAFSSCPTLKEIQLPDQLECLGEYVFYNSGLESLSLPDGLTEIPACMCSCCKSLKSVEIPDTVTRIGKSAFSTCESLESLTIPAGLTEIPEHMCDTCSSLTSIYIPASVEGIGEGAFFDCPNLELIEVEKGNPSYRVVDGLLVDIDCKTLILVPGKYRSCQVPDGIETLKGYSFPSSRTFTSVSIPLSVTTIEECAFAYSFYLEAVYYEGTEEQWQQITIGENGNYGLLHYVTMHYLYEGAPIRAIHVSPNSMTFYEAGASAEFSMEVFPASAADQVVIKSSRETVARVEGTKVIAVAGGSCTIMFQTQDKVTMASISVFVDTPLNLTVNGGQGSGGYRKNEIVTVRADAPKTGQKFAYWTGKTVRNSTIRVVPISGSGCIYDPEIQIQIPSEDFELTAVYEEASAGEESTVWEALSGANANKQSYEKYGEPVGSYLIPTESGFLRAQYQAVTSGSYTLNGEMVLESYDEEYNYLGKKNVRLDLPILGGLYETEDGYIIVTGQRNAYSQETVECYRITKYDKDFHRIAAVGLSDCNTTIPFDAGSCRMAMDGNVLMIHTCHQMYQNKEDGLYHQANVTIRVDTETMTITGSNTAVSNNRTGYVSHSFNQFAAIDQGHLVTIDHGDAFPRALVLMYYKNAVTDENLGNVDSYELIAFPGEEGENRTNASVGGFEISDSAYLTVGNCADTSSLDHKTRNAFLSVVKKDDMSAELKWLTSYPEGETSATTPQLVDLSDGRYLILWGRADNSAKVHYQLVDASGSLLGEIYQMNGQLSDCRPIVKNGKVIWYTYDQENVAFYSISLDTMEGSVRKLPLPVPEPVKEKIILGSDIGVMTEGLTEQYYTGKAIVPEITILDWDHKKTLKENRDYILSFADNIKVGTARMTVTGIGDYGGEITNTFKIVKPKLRTGLSISAATKAIRKETAREGPTGTSYARLQARFKKATKSTIKIGWKKISGAKYVIYGAPCGKNLKKLTTVTGTAFTQKKLIKGIYYRYLVAAFKDGKLVAASIVVYACTTGGKTTNYKAITLKTTSVTLKEHKSKQIKVTGKTKVSSKLSVTNYRGICYESTNPAVAAVTGTGLIKTYEKGKCYIYVYTQEGVMKKITVTVQ